MRTSYTCRQCLSLIKSSRTQLRPSQPLRPLVQNVSSQRNHSTKGPTNPKIALPKRALSTTPSRSAKKPFEPYTYIDPEGIERTRVLTEDTLFNSFTDSPIPQIRKRAAYMRQHAYCPHPSHKPTRPPHNPWDLEARKSSETGTPPAHVDFECPDCGIPVYCCEEHWADDYEAHLGICDVLRQSNEDDHDLRSGRFFKEFQFAEPQIEEILTNMSSWDTYLYTRDFDALNEDREMRQATKLLTYPITVASIINEMSPYNLRNGRMTAEGLKSFSGKHTLDLCHTSR
jgi:splicing suppressor protein 51